MPSEYPQNIANLKGKPPWTSADFC